LQDIPITYSNIDIYVILFYYLPIRQRVGASVKAFANGFVYAFRGVGMAAKGRNMRVHVGAAIAVVLLGLRCGITAEQWTVIVLCIGSVSSAEALNTAIEELCDFATTDKVEPIRRIKDMAAGAVLLCATASAVIATVIFIPYIF
jgi:diacylglycerol kinase (ATP)